MFSIVALLYLYFIILDGEISSELLFIKLSGCLPPAGPLLAAQKWAEKPLGRPQTPIVCLIGPCQICRCLATELPNPPGI